MKDNDRLFAMRERAEKTTALVNLMNETFRENPDENTILAIMASNYDSFWEGWTWHRDVNAQKMYDLMQDFCAQFYASDSLSDMDRDIKTFLNEQGYEL